MVMICGCANNGSVRHWVCVFSLGSIRICVGLMFWIRVEFVGVWLLAGSRLGELLTN